MPESIAVPTPPDDAREDVRAWRYNLRGVIEEIITELARPADPTVDCWGVKLSGQTGWTIDTWGVITGWTERLDTHNAFDGTVFTTPSSGTLRISANIWGGTPGAGSTDIELLIGFFKNSALVTDTVRGTSIRAGYYHTFDAWWVGDCEEGEAWDIRAMFCPAAAGYTTTNATVGAYTEIDAAATQLVSFCRFEIY